MDQSYIFVQKGEKMKLYCPTEEDKLKKLKQKRLWFAWYPIRLTNTNECRWLEWVIRSYPESFITAHQPKGRARKYGPPLYEAVEDVFVEK